MKLIKKILVTAKLEVKTGLHIGGTNTALNIGGPDNFVVRNPITNLPYIPGSSLKGKLRSLIELRDGTLGKDNCATNDPKTLAGALFGTAGKGDDVHASRIIVRDAPLNLDNKEIFENTDMPFTESKTEVSINRLTSSATPRTFERVPAGAIFDVNMVINIFDKEQEKEEIYKKTIESAIKLLEDDYLGGNGSRGYGQVKFLNLKFEEKLTQDYA